MKPRRIWQQGQTLLGALLVALCLLVALFAPQIAPPKDPQAPQMFLTAGRSSDMVPKPPTEQSPLGTLPGQLDVFYTVIWGTRDALRFGLTVVLVSCLFGVVYGAAGGYLGGHIDRWMMRIADAFMTFPVIAAVVFLDQIIAILIIKAVPVFSPAWYGDEVSPMQQFLLTLDPLFIALVLFSWMSYARLVNSNVIRLKGLDYISAAEALGAGKFWVLWRHLLPNAISPAVVLAARDIGGVVILQATFTFIGLGGDSPWGQMLNLGRSWVLGSGGNPFVYWWTFVPGTLALILFSFGWNLMGDGLNDWLNPRRR